MVNRVPEGALGEGEHLLQVGRLLLLVARREVEGVMTHTATTGVAWGRSAG